MTFKKVFSDLEKLILKADHASLEGEFAFQCCVVGDGEGTFYIAFKDGVLDVQPYDYKNHTAVFKADADTYKRVLGGEMTAAEAVEKGLLSVENNESGCADILTFLSAKGTTKKTAAKKPAAKTAAAAKKPAAKTAVKAEAKPAAKAAVKAEPKEEAPAKKTVAAKKPAAKTAAAAKKPGGRKGTK
ncbi:MAG: hypothetical protein K2N29_06260 [Ruminiclostridium sp.]|nr:hypothetical protein [Ruminiclostridium sp.]